MHTVEKITTFSIFSNKSFFIFRVKFVFGTKVIDIYMTESCGLRNFIKANEHICKFVQSIISSLLSLLQK